MDTCPYCGAAVAVIDEWCPKCAQPVNSGQPLAWHATRRRTRWQKTAVSFGPLGRLFWTLAAVSPVAGSVIGLIRFPGPRGGSFWIFGMAVWSVLFMPWILRDIWKAVWLPLEDAGRAQRKADLSNLKFPASD